MHNVIESGLEDYLDGRSSREFDIHLAQCTGCREVVASIQHVSGMLSSLRSDSPPSPPLGFKSRVMLGVQEQKDRGIWGIFSIDPAFARKLAFASLLGLAVLGSYLATDPNDSMAQADHTPEAVLASRNSPSANPQQHLDGMLVTLATYHQ